MIYNQINDRSKTRLAYQISYYPGCASRLISWEKIEIWSKTKIWTRVNELHTHILGPDGQDYKVHWEYNNIPTEAEWLKWKGCEPFLIYFRRSPVCGAVAILKRMKESV